MRTSDTSGYCPNCGADQAEGHRKGCLDKLTEELCDCNETSSRNCVVHGNDCHHFGEWNSDGVLRCTGCGLVMANSVP